MHYSTITELTMMNKEETDAAGYVWRMRVQADPKGRFTDELHEGSLRCACSDVDVETYAIPFAEYLTHFSLVF